MLPDLLTRESASQFKDAIESIEEDTPRQWGEMNAHRMFRHLTYVFEVSFGRVEEPDISKPILRNIFWIFAFNVFTNWPKGNLKAPSSFTPEPDCTFGEEKNRVLSLVDEFIERLENEPDAKTLSPLLGMLTTRKWSRLHGVHLRHHMKQFGAA